MAFLAKSKLPRFPEAKANDKGPPHLFHWQVVGHGEKHMLVGLCILRSYVGLKGTALENLGSHRPLPI